MLIVFCYSKTFHISYPIASILPELHPSYDLLVDEVCSYGVPSRVVPGCEDLLPEEQPPGGVTLLSALLFSILLTLRHSVHHVITAAAQRRHLSQHTVCFSTNTIESVCLGYNQRNERRMDHTHLVKERDVKRETEAILKVDLVCQSAAELHGRGGRICQQGLGGPVHERHRKHYRLLRLGGLG